MALLGHFRAFCLEISEIVGAFRPKMHFSWLVGTLEVMVHLVSVYFDAGAALAAPLGIHRDRSL
jgi:hypothetical protein